MLFTGHSKLTWNLSRWPGPIRTRHRRGTKTKLKILQKTSHSQIKSQNHGKFAAFSRDFIIFCIYSAHSTFSKSISVIHLHRNLKIFNQNLDMSNIMWHFINFAKIRLNIGIKPSSEGFLELKPFTFMYSGILAIFNITDLKSLERWN